MEVGHTMQFYAHIFWLYIFHWNVKFTIVSNVDKDLWNKPFVGNCKWICEYKSASLCLKEGGHKKFFRGDFCSQIVCNFHKDAHLCSQIGWKRREFFKPFSCTFFCKFPCFNGRIKNGSNLWVVFHISIFYMVRYDSFCANLKFIYQKPKYYNAHSYRYIYHFFLFQCQYSKGVGYWAFEF